MSPRSPRRFPLATVGFALAAVAGLLVLLAAPGTRWGVWEFGVGFALLRWGARLAIVAALLSLLAAAATRPGAGRRGFGLAVAGVVVAGVAFFFPWNFRRSAAEVPPIHDVTTDLANPPAFVALLSRRAGATNPPGYAGEEVARQQRAAYPDIAPVMLATSPDSAYRAALVAARDMGWQIVANERNEGRIEAVATTPWWGFRDDVVIRIRPASGIARVDVRSKSRVGGSDLGANAARIRDYLARLRELAPVASEG